MKNFKFILLIIILLLVGCSKEQEIKKDYITINNGSSIEIIQLDDVVYAMCLSVREQLIVNTSEYNVEIQLEENCQDYIDTFVEYKKADSLVIDTLDLLPELDGYNSRIWFIKFSDITNYEIDTEEDQMNFEYIKANRSGTENFSILKQENPTLYINIVEQIQDYFDD